MRILAILLALGLAGPAAAANACHDLWFTRNLLFDRAGYCFGSALGQAMFDNSDCIGTEVSLDPGAAQAVEEIRRLEARIGCAVDTTQTWLDLPDLGFRRVLIDIPVPDELASGCLGWQGPATPLHSGHGDYAGVIGRINPGDFVLFNHLPVAGWSYVTTHGADFAGFFSAGWVRWAYDDTICRAWAG